MVICKVCNEPIDNIRKLSHHLKNVHGMTAQEYHDNILHTNNVCNNPTCNNITTFKNLNIGYLKYCCNSCNTTHNATHNYKKMKDSLLDKYGVDNCSKVDSIIDKRSNTNQDRYGGNAPICSSDIKDKIKSTNTERYGVENVFQSEPVKLKAKDTLVKLYGVDNVMKDYTFAQHKNLQTANTKRSNIYHRLNDSTTFDTMFTLEELGKGLQHYYKIKCKNCNHVFERYFNKYKLNYKCPKCKSGSSIENSIKKFLDDHNVSYLINNRSIIKPYELDFFLPDHNIAIECHGLYWHSENVLRNKGVDNPTTYHKMKHDLCKDKGIQLLQFYEDEIVNKFDIVKNIILAKCNLLDRLTMARKCSVKLVDNATGNNFFDENHIQGRNVGKKTNIGAFFEGQLVAVMSFNTSNDITILDRFCTIKNYYIIGISSKLFSYYIKHYKPHTITTFADNRISNGHLYNTTGFVKANDVAPSYYYVIRNIRKHKSGFMKSKLKHRLKSFDNTLTEYQNMLDNGFDRTWDSGKVKFQWVCTKNS